MQVKYISLNLAKEDYFVDLPLAASNWRAVLSLAKAGYMGEEREEGEINRLILIKKLGLFDRKIITRKQVHGKQIIEIDSNSDLSTLPLMADGLICDQTDIILAITVADCLPLFLLAPAKNVFALLHSGWKGTGILFEAIQKLKKSFKVEPAEIELLIGPGIGSCCYAVDLERYQYFKNQFGEMSVKKDKDKLFLDLRAANLVLASKAGLKKITVINNCTCCEPLLGSYRRDGKEKFCNMLSLLGMF